MTTGHKTGALATTRTLGRAATGGWGVARVLVRGGRSALTRPAMVVASRVGVRAGLALDVTDAIARRARRAAMHAAEEEPERDKPRAPAA